MASLSQFNICCGMSQGYNFIIGGDEIHRRGQVADLVRRIGPHGNCIVVLNGSQQSKLKHIMYEYGFVCVHACYNGNYRKNLPRRGTEHTTHMLYTWMYSRDGDWPMHRNGNHRRNIQREIKFNKPKR